MSDINSSRSEDRSRIPIKTSRNPRTWEGLPTMKRGRDLRVNEGVLRNSVSCNRISQTTDLEFWTEESNTTSGHFVSTEKNGTSLGPNESNRSTHRKHLVLFFFHLDQGGNSVLLDQSVLHFGVLKREKIIQKINKDCSQGPKESVRRSNYDNPRKMAC